jgi:glucose/arabinose dehydrogenase
MHDRRRRPRPAIVTLLALAALAWSATAPLTAFGAVGISLAPVTDGLVAPTQITNAHDGTNRLFVVEQRGTIRVIQGGVLQPGFFMNITGKVAAGGERGLLGLAFDPQFRTNHRLFVYYTRYDGDIVVSRFTTNAARTDVIESTARRLLLIEHSAQSNHNGGAMAFGPNGLLYIGVGDGGGGGDPRNNAQNKGRLLGKILRINVNGTGHGPFGHYSVPRSNPFYGSKPGLEAIWDYGVRNPWRISFDRGTGKLFIADVGQNRFEEIDRERAGFTGGRNYGWNAMEGMHCYTASKCPLAGDTLPNAEYAHVDGNCSITILKTLAATRI